MAADTRLDSAASRGLLQIEDCLDADGNVALPPDVTLISLIERNIANVGDSVAYRYLDHTRSESGSVTELTWTELGRRIRAIGARVQQVASRGDRVAILAPQGHAAFERPVHDIAEHGLVAGGLAADDVDPSEGHWVLPLRVAKATRPRSRERLA